MVRMPGISHQTAKTEEAWPTWGETSSGTKNENTRQVNHLWATLSGSATKGIPEELKLNVNTKDLTIKKGCVEMETFFINHTVEVQYVAAVALQKFIMYDTFAKTWQWHTGVFLNKYGWRFNTFF